MARVPAGGGKRYRPLFGAAGAGIGGAVRVTGGAVKKAAAIKIKTPKPNANAGGGGPTLNDLFGIMTQAQMEEAAHSSASASIAGKAKAIEAQIQAEKDRTAYNVDLMRQVYDEFAQFITQGSGVVQDIYAKAGQQSASFAKGVEDAQSVVTGGINAGINATNAAINAPAGQNVTGDFGANAHIAAQAQNFGDLLAAQGANWAAYMAVQPGIYSKMAVYNIGKLLRDSTSRLALMEAQKAGLSDEESAAYADALGQLQKDQYDRTIKALEYQQRQQNADRSYNLSVTKENDLNKRFTASLAAAGIKSTAATTRQNKTVDPTSSRAAGYLVNKDGTPHLINGKRVKVQGPKAAGPGVVNVTASKAAGQWVDGHGNPVPGMTGVPVPKDPPKAGKTNPRGVAAREKAWNGFQPKLVTQARTTKNSGASYDQAVKQMTESYQWWVNQFGLNPSQRKRLRTRLDAKIKRALLAVGYTPSGTPKSGSTNPFGP